MRRISGFAFVAVLLFAAMSLVTVTARTFPGRHGEPEISAFIVPSDTPGFIVNRVLIPMLNEACFALQEGIGTAPDNPLMERTDGLTLAQQNNVNVPLGGIRVVPGKVFSFRDGRFLGLRIRWVVNAGALILSR